MDADAEVTRNRLGAVNCQVSQICIGNIELSSYLFGFYQRVYRGHVARTRAKTLRIAIAEGIKRAFAERMA
jgi:hypothetical protein